MKPTFQTLKSNHYSSEPSKAVRRNNQRALRRIIFRSLKLI